MKSFNMGFIIGRFQHFHSGHQRMVQAGLDSCEKVLLLVGSSQEVLTERNPFNLKTRMDYIKKVFPNEILNGRLLLGHIDDYTNEDDHSTDWGDFVLRRVDMWIQHYGSNDKMDCLIYGNDEERMSWYKPSEVQNVSQIIVGRPEFSTNATELREYLVKGHINEWLKHVPSAMGLSFNRLREELLLAPYYKNMIHKGEQ